MNPQSDCDVLIVGAGISGISMAAHLGRLCPGLRYGVIERRERTGGTWDLFRYPGVRSDSDMHTLGFRFEPWTDARAIAGGDTILAYLDRVADKYAIRERIEPGTTVVAADWRADEARWRVTLETALGREERTANFLYLASGYYDYDQPHEVRFDGADTFRGEIVHPQFWPAGLEYSGKKVVVIGSGATAVTLVPALAAKAAHVTMLQRTPTWMSAGPSEDGFANLLRRLLPPRLAYWITRRKNIALHGYFYKRARREPEAVGPWLSGKLRETLGEHYSERDFLPPYPPWDQRLCLVPDGDLFEAIRSGTASVVTAAIDRFDAGGVRLANGDHLDADIIVTATGLRLSLGGKIAISLDGKRVDFSRHWMYRSCMFSNVPNLAAVFGYLNAAWTLRADNTADYCCRLLAAMEARRADAVVPCLAEDHGLEEVDPIPFSSGYLQRARALFPRMAATLPWRLGEDYAEDCRDLRKVPVADGILQFSRLKPFETA